MYKLSFAPESGVSMDAYRLYCCNKLNRYYSHKLTNSTKEPQTFVTIGHFNVPKFIKRAEPNQNAKCELNRQHVRRRRRPRWPLL